MAGVSARAVHFAEHTKREKKRPNAGRLSQFQVQRPKQPSRSRQDASILSLGLPSLISVSEVVGTYRNSRLPVKCYGVCSHAKSISGKQCGRHVEDVSTGAVGSRWRGRADEESTLDLEEGWVTSVLGESGTARMQEPLTG